MRRVRKYYPSPTATSLLLLSSLSLSDGCTTTTKYSLSCFLLPFLDLLASVTGGWGKSGLVGWGVCAACSARSKTSISLCCYYLKLWHSRKRTCPPPAAPTSLEVEAVVVVVTVVAAININQLPRLPASPAAPHRHPLLHILSC